MTETADTFDLRSGTFNATDEWLSRVGASLAQLGVGARDFRLANVGDSIATGMLGITTTSDHYTARTAGLVARAHGRRWRRGPVSEGANNDGGWITVAGRDWRRDLNEGAYFGAGSYELLPEGSAVLSYAPDGAATSFTMSFGGNIEYSIDSGTTWIRPEATRLDYSRLEIPNPAHPAPSKLQIRAPKQSGAARIYSLSHSDESDPCLTWFTSGVGGARMTDLFEGLSVNEERGFRAYGSAELDLLTIGIGVNDTIHADEVTTEDSASALRAIIRGLARYGVENIALVGACPVRPDYQPGPWSVAEAYESIYRPISLELGVPLLEWSSRWGDWAEANRQGYYSDHVHPSRDGHWDAGAMVAGLLLRASRHRLQH
jgi:lysophospholipase L1-like esterase